MYRNKILLPLFFATLALASLAQPVNNAVKSVVMAPPNAAALGKYGDIPVNLHTGVPGISVPVTTVQEGPLSLDISLSYHASGIKIAETASWIGLGWSLNAGGVISRTVQGLRDEGPGGYYAITTPVPWPMNNNQVIQYGTILDGEPDIFSFNVGGYTGKFFINKDKTVHLVPKQDLKILISPAGSELFGSFIILSPDGTKYYFGSAPGDGTTTTAREQSTVDDPTTLVTSSWFLRRIESPDGFYSITLSYTDEEYSFKTPASCEYKYISCLANGSYTQTWNCSNTAVDPEHYYNRVLVKGKRLASIATTTATVTFVPASAGREDLEAYPPLSSPLPRALDKIKVEQTAAYCTEFRFTYDYFTDPSHNTIPEGKRLRLKELLEISCDGTTRKEPYKFTYQGNFLPWRLSHMVDHWGFYNGSAGNESQTINAPPTTVVSAGNVFNYGQSDRNSSESPMLDGVLTKIDYPTGGNTQFTFEANDYPTTESYTYNNYLLQVSNCTYPQACCGTQYGETTRSFTADELSGARYKFTLINPTCYNGGQPACNPQYPIQTQLEIFQMPGNIPVSTSTVLNIYGSTCEDTIGGMLVNFVTLQPGISYRFKVSGINGKGTFQIYKYAQGYNYINKKVGGLRIKQIKSHDAVSTANDIVKTYEYRAEANPAVSSGNLFYTPVYGYGLVFMQTQLAYFRDGAIVPMSGFENYHIGYSLVTEVFNGNGKVKHSFIIEAMSGNQYSFPVKPEPARLQNGFESASAILDAGGAVVGGSSTSLYAGDAYILPNGSPNTKVKVVRIAATGCVDDPIFAFSDPYSMRTRHVRPGIATSTVDGVSTTQTFNYESTKTYAPPTEVSVTNSDNKVTKTEYKYPWNLTGFVADSLKKRNIIGTPVETIVKVGNVQADGTKLDYALYDKTSGLRLSAGSANANPYPWKYYRYEATFDANGNIAAGAAYDLQDEIADYYGSANTGKGYPKTWTKTAWPSETYEWETSGRLKKRTYLGFITEYTWNSGTRLVQKIKAPDGQETWYDYDKLSRLSKVWARPATAGVKSPANLTTEYFYQYKNTGNAYNFVKTLTTYGAPPGGGGASNLSTRELFQYLDGLGRLIQTVGKKQSPAQKDVALQVEYDKWGRQVKTYNPCESGANTGAFVAVPPTTPHTLTEYYSDPLNRVWKATPPSWYATTTTYGTNATGEVKLDHAATTFYPAGSLIKVSVTEPGPTGAGSGNKIITYKDKKGRTILVKRTSNNGSESAETYSLYDNKDRLSLVIPPGAAWNSSGLTFSYTYDGADNLLSKKVPDAAAVTMKYNTRDQLVLEQDGNLLAQNKWRCIRYDDYGRPLKTGLFSGTIPSPIPPTLDPTDLYTENTYDGTLAIEKGKLKKARVRVFDAANTWLETNYTYDTYGRISSASGNNYLLPADLGAETSTYAYDFADNILTDTRNSKQNATTTHTITQKHDFDHWGRLKSNKHKVNTAAEVTVSDLNYNWKEQLVEKNLGKVAVGTTTSYLQSLDYAYNEQGWLLSINNPALGGTNVTLQNCPQAPNPGSVSFTVDPDNKDLFYLELKYDQLQNGLNGTAQKNGNISQIIWRTRGRERQAYSLTYDFLDRVTLATFNGLTDATIPVLNNINAYNEAISYDSRGNITNLQRTGKYILGGVSCWSDGQIDNLTYTYNTGSNKLQKINDNAPVVSKQYGWNNTSNAVSTAQYDYDANGNMVGDPYKGIVVSYNFLNLPYKVSFTGSGTSKTIDILYDASGRKLRKIVANSGATVSKQDYNDEIEYRNNILEAIYHEEGRVYNLNGALRYEYAINDHLGSTRLMFTDKNNNGYIEVSNATNNEIIQENHYYVFGVNITGPWINEETLDNLYQYNNKELNVTYELNWYDYGARWYDAVIGRWWSTDLLAEDYLGWSPYNYVKNTPINGIDPDGLSSTDWKNNVISAQIDDSKTLPTVEIKAKRIKPIVREEYRQGNYRLFRTDNAWYYEKQIAGSNFNRLEYRVGFDRDNEPQMIYHISMWQQNMYGVADKFAEGMFTAAGFVAAGTLEGLIVKAVVARTGAATVGRVFWSGAGNSRVAIAAKEFATKNGMITLNMTRAGRNLEKLTQGLPDEVQHNMWRRLSAQFARGAQKEVHVFQNATKVDINSTWGTVEFPILKSKGIKIIYHIIE